MEVNNKKMDSENNTEEDAHDDSTPIDGGLFIDANILKRNSFTFRSYNRHDHLVALITGIKSRLSEHKEKNNVECFCESSIPIENTHDIFKNYGILCYCMINHIKTIQFDFNLFIDMFILEFNLVNYLKEESKDISQILKPETEIVSEDIENQYICAYSTFIRDSKIHINCEQPIESLTFKYYKKFIKNQKQGDTSSLDYLLFMLYIRKESERFFKVFAEIPKTSFNCRITLLLSLHQNCCKNSDEILKSLKKYNTICSGLINEIGGILEEVDVRDESSPCLNETPSPNKNQREAEIQVIKEKIKVVEAGLDRVNLEKRLFIKKNLWDDIMFNKYDKVFSQNITLFERQKLDKFLMRYEFDENSGLILLRTTVVILNILELETDVDSWFQRKKEKYEWSNNVKKWGLNRDPKLDADMISCCSTYRKFDEGFLIYSELVAKDEQAMTRACSLCLNAFKITEDRVWLERIYDILNNSFVNHSKETWRNLTMLIFENLRLLDLQGRKDMIVNIVEYFDRFHLEKDEHLIKCLMKGFFTMVSQCKESKLCDICHKYALFIYYKWKMKNDATFTFFKKSKVHCDDIYSYVLGVCDESNDSEKFHDICRDILRSNDGIGESVLCRLEKYHEKCRCRKYSIYTHTNEKAQCRKLLRHCMSEFKE